MSIQKQIRAVCLTLLKPILLFLCSISCFSMGLTFIERYLETFYIYSIVCSREVLSWYYFNPVSKLYCLLGYIFNYWKEWSMQNTACDFFNFFSYLERTFQGCLFSLQRKLNIILSSCTVLLWCEDSEFVYHLPLKKKIFLRVLLQTWNGFWLCLSIFEKTPFLFNLWPYFYRHE